ncbi:metallophosphoesterase family protein [Sulfoacidibacillus thermotolerans]|uniref:DNA repair exonuclease n=1 Tax=Sulfoacidibacillus thermotolerans TaxID=1765684 RepID=A0A2U3D7K6_SULT2|nr:DNA repair exonuclease [Sulfoacidibacillus thermotolerans]PWI57233.1 DNA repair exonuclease [Sulfoacidibacillus thermotolerans]
MFTFIHCADLHLDSPLRGLSARDDLPEADIRLATRRALQNLVDLSIAEHVAFVVIAGDVYDGDWEDYETGLYFNRCMAQLGEHGITVYLIRGNHDAASHMTHQLNLPKNVYRFSETSPETILLNDLGVAIHGQGFATREVFSDLVTEYPSPVLGYFNIGILHTSLQGQPGHEPYAPCRLEDLVQKGYDYWALGHIHKRQILYENPFIVYPGNIQGRHIRETGDKGCTLVTVDGSHVELRHCSLDVLRFEVITLDLSGIESEEMFALMLNQEFLQVIARNAGYPLILRVIIVGQTLLHELFLRERERYQHEVLSASYLLAGARLWIEKVQFQTESAIALNVLKEAQDLLPTLTEAISAAAQDEQLIQDFLSDMKKFLGRMGEYTKLSDHGLLDSHEDLQVLREETRQMLTALLQGGSGE